MALALALLACAAPASASVASERVRVPADDVLDFWTQERMQAAEPLGAEPRAAGGRALECVPLVDPCAEEVRDASAAGVRTHGKVYFVDPAGEPTTCSGTVVRAARRSVVWTAGHCVFEPDDPDTTKTNESAFMTNWMFVPAYRDGEEPYGRWAARRLATTGPWEAGGNIKYDLGAAVLRHDAAGRHLQDVVGYRKLAFDRPRDQVYQAFGYPADPTTGHPEFQGERQYTCTSPEREQGEPGTAGPPTIAIRCDMSPGSSGGGWIVGNKLLSVTSYGYRGELDRLYGPYMSTTAKALYLQVRGSKKKKGGGKKGGPKQGGGKKGGKRG